MDEVRKWWENVEDKLVTIWVSGTINRTSDTWHKPQWNSEKNTMIGLSFMYVMCNMIWYYWISTNIVGVLLGWVELYLLMQQPTVWATHNLASLELMSTFQQASSSQEKNVIIQKKKNSWIHSLNNHNILEIYGIFIFVNKAYWGLMPRYLTIANGTITLKLGGIHSKLTRLDGQSKQTLLNDILLEKLILHLQ